MGIAKAVVSTVVPGAGTAIGIVESLTKRTRRVERVGAQVAKFSSLVDPGSVVSSSRNLGSGGCILPFRRDPKTGRCRIFFGEQSGPNGGGTTLAPVGDAVMGGFGLPAMVPVEVGQIQRANGTVGPILRCARGFVLGTDNLCYPKAVLPRRSQFRKWRGATRPLISGADVKAIRRAARAKGRVLELAKDIGLHASAKPPSNSAAKELKILKAQHLLAPPAVIVGTHH